ncbi:MAG: hypothetical protein U0441_01155 [Polyangiaceae bacterium]
MNATKTITLQDLLLAYLDTRRPQVHPVMTDHVEKTLLAFETALNVKIPREADDVSGEMRPLFFLFRGTVDSLLDVRTALSGFLEAGLIYTRLEALGEPGRAILEDLQLAGEQAEALRRTQLDVLERLLHIFLHGARPSVTMADVRATGLYPGDTPKDFDIFDHM